MSKINPHQYPAEVFWSDDDEGFIAIAPDLPGCSAWGANDGEAIAELRQAIVAWIEAASAAGNAIPAPSHPVAPEQFSGKFLIRMPKRLHADLDRNAKKDGVSLNQYVVFLLTEANTARTVEMTLLNISRADYQFAARTFGAVAQQFFRSSQYGSVEKLASASTLNYIKPSKSSALVHTPLQLTTQ